MSALDDRQDAEVGAARTLGRLDLAFLAAGVGLLAVLVATLGVEDVWGHLRLVGAGVLLVVAQEILAYAANTLGWYAAFRPPRPAIRPQRLLAARIVGDGINYLTPTVGLGGEFVRARYLRDDASPTVLAASVSVAKVSQFIAQVVFVIVGLAFVLQHTDLPQGLRDGVRAGLLLFMVLGIGLVLAQRRGAFGPMLRFVRRLGFVREHPALAETVARLDIEIADYHRGSGAFLWSVLAFGLGWALGFLEVALMLWLLDVPVTLQTVVAIEVLSIIVDSFSFFVPAKAGTQEAGKVVIFTLLGLDPAKGLSLGILRRVRELTWAGIGLLLLWRSRAK